MHIKIIPFLIALFFIKTYSQSDIKIKPHQQFYVYGDATVIGNNIVGKHKIKRFNDTSVNNDLTKMVYIDVDNSPLTFSSSEANLEIPKGAKVVSASLYWSAVYGYNKGSKKIKGRRIIYKGDDKPRDTLFNYIKFKTPFEEYKNIQGNILYDEYKTVNNEYENAAPVYVCHADVTGFFKGKEFINGTYTIANVRATQGYISGGSAGGWLLFVVYESPLESPKYISTYNGLVHLYNQPLDLKIQDFKTPDEGNIKGSLFLATIEGDSNLKKDQCLIFREPDSTYVPLQNDLRANHNFFNSTITKGNKMFDKRNPNSLNTLGFDLAEIEIPNQNNTIIKNGETQFNTRFVTKYDSFKLFFMAFKTEIDDSFNLLLNQNNLNDVVQINLKELSQTSAQLEKAKTSSDLNNKVRIKNRIPEISTVNFDITNVGILSDTINYLRANKQNSLTNIKQEVAYSDKLKSETNQALARINTILDDNNDQPNSTEGNLKESTTQFSDESIIEIEKLIGQKSYRIPGLEAGYYVITNVFSVPSNANKWDNFLVEKGYNVQRFINPENNWDYASVFKSKDVYQAYALRNKLNKLDYFTGIWVFKVNLNDQVVFVN